MTSLIRSAVLTSFADVAAACGLDARALLAEVGLPLRCLDEPDLKMSADAVAALLELRRTAAATKHSACAWRNRGACRTSARSACWCATSRRCGVRSRH